jgi:predicted  nucleic acid-binding Zn-ribbon protein
MLRELQAIDQEWAEKGRIYQDARAQLGDQTELQAIRDAHQAREKDLVTSRTNLRNAELELDTLQEHVRRIHADLYGGNIRSPRELENLRQESMQLAQRIDRLEEQTLADMSRVDDLQTEVEASREALREYEARRISENETLTSRYRELHARLQGLQRRREEIRATLSRSDLGFYDELRVRKGGAVLSPMKDNICQTCRVKVPSNKVQVVRTGETAIACEGCGRILYEDR